MYRRRALSVLLATVVAFVLVGATRVPVVAEDATPAATPLEPVSKLFSADNGGRFSSSRSPPMVC